MSTVSAQDGRRAGAGVKEFGEGGDAALEVEDESGESGVGAGGCGAGMGLTVGRSFNPTIRVI